MSSSHLGCKILPTEANLVIDGAGSRQRHEDHRPIGHSNLSIEAFIGLLQQTRMEVIVDTRSYPIQHAPFQPGDAQFCDQ